MILFFSSSAMIGVVASFIIYVYLMQYLPRLPRLFMFRLFLGFPMACAPIVVGFLLTDYAFRHLQLVTTNLRVAFMFLWLGILTITTLSCLIKVERRKKAGTYWRWKDRNE
jgi:peptidoglycan biosynthesis protein MviN/MurJ (putative lipid II flippase)